MRIREKEVNMTLEERIELFQKLNSTESLHIDVFYDILEQCDALKSNYHNYMKTV
jgi:hypothetical protein